jgi:hypothetical protein
VRITRLIAHALVDHCIVSDRHRSTSLDLVRPRSTSFGP